MSNPLLDFVIKFISHVIIAGVVFFFCVGSFLASSIGVNQYANSNILVKIIIFISYGFFNWAIVFLYFVIICKIFGKCIKLGKKPFPFYL